MSNKLVGKKQKTPSATIEIMGQLTEFAVALVMMILCAVLPLYAKDGYSKIGDAKFEIYRKIMLPGCGFLLLMALLYMIFWIIEKGQCRVSVTDYFVLAYLLFSGIAFINGGFYKSDMGSGSWDSLWAVLRGSPGWNMGFMAQLSFVLLYFFLSRFGRQYGSILKVLCATATVVFILGILHRLQFDPIGFYDGLNYEQKAQFLSTLGQATWYASFLVTILPVGIAVFIYADSRKGRIFGGLFTFIGFCTLVTQNSDSAYFAVLGFLLVFLWAAVSEKEKLLRYLFVCIMLLAAGKLMYFLLKINPNPELDFDFVTELILSSLLTWVLLVLCIGAYVLLYLLVKPDAYPSRLMRRIRDVIYGVAGIGIIGVVVLIVLNAKGLLPEMLAGRLSAVAYMDWGSEWGNGRGKIWTFAMKVFKEEDMRYQLFGIGADCFMNYIAANHSEEARLLWGDKLLTNAHNEWLNIFINTGLFGGVAYTGIFVSAISRFMKRRRQSFLLAGVSACIVSYMAYNFFCYQQVLCTPFIFILIGIGEYLVREEADA